MTQQRRFTKEFAEEAVRLVQTAVADCQVERSVLVSRTVLWWSIMRTGTFETGTDAGAEIVAEINT
jgi:hypothetical protein